MLNNDLLTVVGALIGSSGEVMPFVRGRENLLGFHERPVEKSFTMPSLVCHDSLA